MCPISMGKVTIYRANTSNVTSGYISGAAGKQVDENRVVLPIVAVYVKAPGSQGSVKTHALLDTGSTNSFCTEGLLRQLGVQGWKEDILLNTMAKSSESTRVTVASLEVKGIHGVHTLPIPSVLAREAVPIGTQNIVTDFDEQLWPHLQGFEVPRVHEGEVTLLIGQDIPEALAPISVVRGRPGEPYAVQTSLGWSVCGPMKGKEKTRVAMSHFISPSLEQQVEQF